MENLIEAALAQGDAAGALEQIDHLPADARLPWLLRAWRLVGSPAHLAPLVAQMVAVSAELAEVVAHGVPETALPTGELATLEAAQALAAAQGRAHDLAYLHIALAAIAPRVDQRVAHLAHAATLAQTLADRRLAVRVGAAEAALDAYLGEDEDARDGATWALAEALAVGAPLAAAQARAALDTAQARLALRPEETSA